MGEAEAETNVVGEADIVRRITDTEGSPDPLFRDSAWGARRLHMVSSLLEVRCSWGASTERDTLVYPGLGRSEA